MLFNSLAFLLVALPAALAVHALASRWVPRARAPVLLAISVLFYGLFDWRFVPLVGAMIGVNWGLTELFLATRRPAPIAAAVVVAVGLLAAFKYLGFIDGLLGIGLPPLDWIAPVGISFITFQQIMYAVDLRRGRTERLGLLDYALYVAFFPKIVAGPLLAPGDFAAQLARLPERSVAAGAAPGALLLLAGLAKKVFLADPLGDSVNPLFAAVAAGTAPTLSDAWQMMLGYTFQLYFDFSGYTDMAMGVALLLGIALPQNFDAPYRATSLQDFWRRWHMTLSRFLRDYLYIPMGGNRHGVSRQVAALVATMALGGLWHGAGLTFVAWGLAHGVGQAVQLLWRRTGRVLPDGVAWPATFAFVALAWVVFRAPDLGSALAIYRALVPGHAPTGGGLTWALLAVAAALSTIGPTAWTLAHAARPRIWVGVAAALVLVAVLVKVGDDRNVEFIYAQF